MPERPRRLRVEHLDDAFGLDTRSPRVSWWLPAGAERQLAYQLRADNGWDTGRVASAESVLVPYSGPPLGARDRVGWQVRVWTPEGESDWSEVCEFELGLLAPEDWTAAFVEPHEAEVGAPGRRLARLLRSDFSLPSKVVRARLYATAHGIYEAFVNGVRVGDRELTPGYTSYGARLQVQTYDVTELLTPGVNAIGAIVSDGWYRGQVGLPRAHDQWGSALALLAQLEVAHADGSWTCVGTGAGWRAAPAHLEADLIAGQTTDLRREPRGWSHPGFDDTGWDPVTVVAHDLERLVASPAPPVRAVAEIEPVSVTAVNGAQIADLGQNINGWVRLRGLGAGDGAITLTHAEALARDGDITTEHLEVDLPFIPGRLAAGQVDRVISAGGAEAVFEPRHTTHGFQFVRVEGAPETVEVTGVAVHTDMTRTGWFECSDERLNRLHEAAVWSLRGNACDIPTDCPTRERAGWTGDWQIFVPTAAYLYDVAGFSTKWLRDLAAEQWPNGLVANLAPSPPLETRGGPLEAMNGSAGWGDAAVIVPWEIYRAYGDTELLAAQWDSMVAWLEYVTARAAGERHPERAARAPQAAPHERYLWDSGFHWGEWLVPGADLKGPDEFEAFRRADKSDVATAYFARSAELMGRIAGVLGRDAEAVRYAELARRVRDAWRAEFIAPDGAVAPDTQANLVRALAFKLIPPQLRPRAAERLVALIQAAGGHLQTGFLATPYLLPVLAQTGHLDVAYALLACDTEPSWLTMIERGATTLWERWNGIDAAGTPYESLNHYSKGAVIGFLHRVVAGLELLDGHPGYRHFRIAPRPGGGLTWAWARHDCPYGPIEVEWARAGEALAVTVAVPPGTTAELVLPGRAPERLAPGRHTRREPPALSPRV